MGHHQPHERIALDSARRTRQRGIRAEYVRDLGDGEGNEKPARDGKRKGPWAERGHEGPTFRLAGDINPTLTCCVSFNQWAGP